MERVERPVPSTTHERCSRRVLCVERSAAAETTYDSMADVQTIFTRNIELTGHSVKVKRFASSSAFPLGQLRPWAIAYPALLDGAACSFFRLVPGV